MKLPDTIIGVIRLYVNAISFALYARMTEDDMLCALHHTTGRLIRNRYRLWDASAKITGEFNQIGVVHPDDMSCLILKSAHRILNHRPVDLRGQVAEYKGITNASNKNRV